MDRPGAVIIGKPVPNSCLEAGLIAPGDFDRDETKRPIGLLDQDPAGVEYVCSILAILADEPMERREKTANDKTIAKKHLDHIKDASAIGYVYNHIVFRPGLSQEDAATTPSGTTANACHHFWPIYNASHKRTKTQYACAIRFRLRCVIIQKKISQISPKWCLSHLDATSTLAAAFNQNTFGLFGIDEFEPSSLIQGANW